MTWMRFEVTPVSGICDCCFTNRTIGITTFVIPFIVRMNCLVAVLTYVMLQNTQYPLVPFIIKVLATRLWVLSLDKAKLSYKEIVIEESKQDCGMKMYLSLVWFCLSS